MEAQVRPKKHVRRKRRDVWQFLSTVLWLAAAASIVAVLIWSLGDFDFGDVKIRSW